jgi:hypothetical protein
MPDSGGTPAATHSTQSTCLTPPEQLRKLPHLLRTADSTGNAAKIRIPAQFIVDCRCA